MKFANGVFTVVGGAALAVALLGLANAGAKSPVAPAKAAKAEAVNQQIPAFAGMTKDGARMTEAKPAGNGLNTGITVHGHWVIEVKNPDGTVTSRREFENSIRPSGQIYLASLLAGNNSPGGLSILLNGANATLCPGFGCPLPNSGNGNSLIYSSEAGPCMPLSNIADSPVYVTYGNNGGGSVCLITGSSTYLASYASGDISELPASVTPPVSLNLTVSGPTFPTSLASAPTQLTLRGSVPVTSSASGQYVDDVETIFTTCTAGSTAAGCANYATNQTQTPGPIAVALNLFTQKIFDGQGTDPAPVPYSQGQTIAVTVTISFQ